MNNKPTSRPIIIPIAGGKGGVGKTFLTANLAIALAELNKTTIVIDLDLGGSNLYSWLGLKNTYMGIGDFLFSGDMQLSQCIVNDLRQSLSYIPGDGQTSGLANIKHLQKLKILKSIASLKAEFILLDLSAGTTFNTLDFFRMARSSIVVISPETTSIMNALGFFKNFLLRIVSRKFRNNMDVLEILDKFRKQRVDIETNRFVDVVKKIEDSDSAAAAEIRRICQFFIPRIVFNMGRDRDDLSFGKRLSDIIKEYLMLDVEFIGFLEWDKNVPRSVNKGIPFLDQFPESPTSVSIHKIASRLVKYGRNRIENSFEKLYASLEEPKKDSSS